MRIYVWWKKTKPNKTLRTTRQRDNINKQNNNKKGSFIAIKQINMNFLAIKKYVFNNNFLEFFQSSIKVSGYSVCEYVVVVCLVCYSRVNHLLVISLFNHIFTSHFHITYCKSFTVAFFVFFFHKNESTYKA